MWLIATDEAGYGPKLGPLVIVATVWRLVGHGAGELADQTALRRGFEPLSRPVRCGRLEWKIEDSKAAYRASHPEGRRRLHAALSCSLRWCGWDPASIGELLALVAEGDLRDLKSEPWFDRLEEPPWLSAAEAAAVIAEWSAEPAATASAGSEAKMRPFGVVQQDMLARVITPRRFNACCRRGQNKSDLLTESTLDLVRRAVDRHVGRDEAVQVFCDRHGGRRYYAAAIARQFADGLVGVVSEDAVESRYRIPRGGATGEIRFTVRGDKFEPVAMSSLVAKYLRECCMDSLNRYFARDHEGDTPLKPTAGYPVDADRFIGQVREACRRRSIADDDWIRTR